MREGDGIDQLYLPASQHVLGVPLFGVSRPPRNRLAAQIGVDVEVYVEEGAGHRTHVLVPDRHGDADWHTDRRVGVPYGDIRHQEVRWLVRFPHSGRGGAGIARVVVVGVGGGDDVGRLGLQQIVVVGA